MFVRYKIVFVPLFLFRFGPLSAVLVTRLKGTSRIVNNLTFLWFHFNVECQEARLELLLFHFGSFWFVYMDDY